MDTLSYFHPVAVSSTWNDQSYNPKWSAPSPTQSSEALESFSRGSPSLSFSEGSVFSSLLTQQDLLPELWLEKAPHNQIMDAEYHNQAQQFQSNNNTMECYQIEQQQQNYQLQQHSNFSHSPSAWNEKPRSSNPPPGLTATAVLRDSSLEYAQSLLPHSLLMPLTQENLDYHKAAKAQYNEIFSFENHENEFVEKHPHMLKARNNSVSSSTSSANSAQSGGSGVSSKTLKSMTKSLNTQLYKTELCMSFMKTNVCPYGNKCQFAHGEAELKRVERPLNWRSKPCANWTRYGLCRYGKRCCFKHGE